MHLVQQGPTGEHRERCSMLCGSLDGRGVWRKTDTHRYMAESLCCSSETITTLFIGYTPIENNVFFLFVFFLNKTRQNIAP